MIAHGRFREVKLLQQNSLRLVICQLGSFWISFWRESISEGPYNFSERPSTLVKPSPSHYEISILFAVRYLRRRRAGLSGVLRWPIVPTSLKVMHLSCLAYDILLPDCTDDIASELGGSIEVEIGIVKT
jgi:hypothetical protein